MAKPPPGKCVHCLIDFHVLTWDHVFPTSWYPNTTPADLEKWKFPSCEPCNLRYSKIEQSLLIAFGLCLTPGEAISAGIPEKALRAAKPEFATNEKDRQARLAMRNKILSQAKKTSGVPTHGLFPGFGPQPGIQYPEQITFPISSTQINQFTEKLARGITWKINDKLITPDFEITTSILRDDDALEVYGPMLKSGSLIDIGPGFRIWHAAVPEDKTVSALAVQIWGRVKLYALVSRRDIQTPPT